MKLKTLKEFIFTHRKTSTTLGIIFGVSSFIIDEFNPKNKSYKERYLELIKEPIIELRPAIVNKTEVRRESKGGKMTVLGLDFELNNYEMDKAEKFILKIIQGVDNINVGILKTLDVIDNKYLLILKFLTYTTIYGLYGRYWYLTIPFTILFKLRSL